MTHDITLTLIDETATLDFGARLSQALSAGTTIYLHGDLGAGKTTLVRGLLHAMGHVGKVKSPTYTLVEPYDIQDKLVYHFDLYRLIDPMEWEAAGFRDYFNQQSICLVEWPEKAEELLPQSDIEIYLSHLEQGRKVVMKANTAGGRACLERF